MSALSFTGYAAIFNDRDAVRDIILPGAFKRTLSQRVEMKSIGGGRFPLYWQHNPDQRIGWVEKAFEDDHGLRIVASIDSPEGGAAAALRSGQVNGLSFGYRARKFNRDGVGRTLQEVDLFEVSLVTHPAHHKARVMAVSVPTHPTAGEG